MLIDRRNLREHLPWIVFLLLSTGGASFWFFAVNRETADWPGGSSWPGFTFGVVGAAIILFEMLLWPRKMLRTWRIGRVKTWMRAHIWLGLLCFPLFIYHSGFSLGGQLSAVTLIVLFIVLGSGIWGLLLQQFLPQTMLNEVPAETIYSQIVAVVEQICSEAERLVSAVCGPRPGELPVPHEEQLVTIGGGPLTVGAVRSAGRVQGKVVQTRVPSKPIPDTESLREFYDESLHPFLVAGKDSDSPLQVTSKAGMTSKNTLDDQLRCCKAPRFGGHDEPW